MTIFIFWIFEEVKFFMSTEISSWTGETTLRFRSIKIAFFHVYQNSPTTDDIHLKNKYFMLNPHLFLEALRVNGELKNCAQSLSRSQFNLLKIVIFGNMTIWIWQLFWKFNKYDNLQYDNYFEHMKIWQLFRKNCHIWISKYDKKKTYACRSSWNTCVIITRIT